MNDRSHGVFVVQSDGELTHRLDSYFTERAAREALPKLRRFHENHIPTGASLEVREL